ncbi:MAG: hypothetical protein DHS20C11_20310 [Lysobacteraceae bacterium]|nr:MAG: hypothetical protein DHS20C11_20310 [Xanthomonadaceae bacterium]
MQTHTRSPLFVAIHLSLGLAISAATMAEGVQLSDLGTGGFRIDGVSADDRSGFAVSGAGDVNGDGLADLIVGVRSDIRKAYVVFGKADNSTVELNALGDSGFTIEGGVEDGLLGWKVSGAGDVNGDGLADIIVGAMVADPDGRTNAGAAYVVFGKTDNDVVDVNVLGQGGFQIQGAEPGDEAGATVSGAGDVNGDGFADVVVGARSANYSFYNPGGASFVVFGKSSTSPVDLADLGLGGFRVDGVLDTAASRASGAGDVNGDGLDDIIIGAPSLAAGRSYLVYGRTDNTPIHLGSLGSAGFRVDGIDDGDQFGYDVSGAGDINGDGYADLIVGAWRADPNGQSMAGESTVVFGPAPGSGGFRIDGIGAGDYSGRRVSGAGDLNGDGKADLIVGADGASPNGQTSAGESYVIFGKDDNTTVDLASLGTDGFRIEGIDANDFSGRSVSAAGDVNGDGLADIIIGAYGADAGNASTGESYVVFSPSVPASESQYSFKAAPGLNTAFLPAGVVRNGSDDDSPSAQAWLSFDSGDLSTQVVTLTRTDLGLSGLDAPSADVAWHFSSDRTGWNSADLKVRYSDCQINGLAESALQLVAADSPEGPWTTLPTSIDSQRNQASTLGLASLGYIALIDADILFSDTFELTNLSSCNETPVCTSLAQPIPDNDPAGATSSINIAESQILAGMKAVLVSDHARPSDLSIELSHTVGSIMLMDRPGVPASPDGCLQEGINALFDDHATRPIEDACGSGDIGINGVYAPEGSLRNLVDGSNFAGDWEVTVTDNVAGETGNIMQVCLIPIPKI